MKEVARIEDDPETATHDAEERLLVGTSRSVAENHNHNEGENNRISQKINHMKQEEQVKTVEEEEKKSE